MQKKIKKYTKENAEKLKEGKRITKIIKYLKRCFKKTMIVTAMKMNKAIKSVTIM